MLYEINPRNDFVLVRISQATTTDGGIALPDVAAQGKRFHVEAVGPDVTRLAKGDRVLLYAKEGTGDYYPVPWERNLILLKQEHVGAIVKELP